MLEKKSPGRCRIFIGMSVKHVHPWQILLRFLSKTQNAKALLKNK